MLQFCTLLVSREALVYHGVLGVAFSRPGRQFRTDRGRVRQPAIQVLTGQDGELDLHHIEPTAVHRRSVKLELANDTARFGRIKRFIEYDRCVREMVKDVPNAISIREVQIDQGFHTLSNVGFGTPVGDFNMLLADVRLAEQI